VVLAEFSALHPDVRLVVELSDKMVDLVAEGFDLGLRSGEVRDGSLVARLVGHAPIGVYGSPDYLRRHGEPRHPEELTGHRLLLLGSGAGAVPWSFVVEGTPLDVAPVGVLTCTGQLALRDAAIAGAGLARLPGFVVADALQRKELVTVLGGFVAPPRPFYVVWPSGRFVSAKVKAFAALVGERLPAVLASGLQQHV
jgi:DNA-binding transcriptional LysR family regulator